jgi:hypothetical protein
MLAQLCSVKKEFFFYPVQESFAASSEWGYLRLSKPWNLVASSVGRKPPDAVFFSLEPGGVLP